MCVFAVPQAPTLLSVTASDPGTLNVTWAEPTTPNGVIISYTVAANNRAIVRADVTGTEVVLSGLDPYTSYSVSVQACTSEGCGSFSDEITVTTLEEGEVLYTIVLHIECLDICNGA